MLTLDGAAEMGPREVGDRDPANDINRRIVRPSRKKVFNLKY